jgi:hypothetical protein
MYGGERDDRHNERRDEHNQQRTEPFHPDLLGRKRRHHLPADQRCTSGAVARSKAELSRPSVASGVPANQRPHGLPRGPKDSPGPAVPQVSGEAGPFLAPSQRHEGEDFSRVWTARALHFQGAWRKTGRGDAVSGCS